MKHNVTLTLILAAFSSAIACAQQFRPANPAPVRLQVVSVQKAGQLTPVTTTPIVSQPEGDLLPNLEWTSRACYAEGQSAVWKDREGLVAEVVRKGNEMYLHNPVSMLAGSIS